MTAGQKTKKRGRGRPKGTTLPDRIISIGKHPRGWRVVYQLGGKRRAEYRMHESSIRARAAQIEQRIKHPNQKEKSTTNTFKLGNGSTKQDWLQALWWASIQVMQNKSDEDARAVARTLAQTCKAASPLITDEELLKRIEDLERLALEFRAHKIHGTRFSGEADGPREGIQPTLPIQ